MSIWLHRSSFFFRIGATEQAIGLIENNLDTLQDVPVIFKILLLTCILEEDYEYAFLLVKKNDGELLSYWRRSVDVIDGGLDHIQKWWLP
ncbi:hypothetical protein OS11_29080 [Dickeya oryzae]